MEENRNAYSEVIEILKLIDDEEKLEKMPIEMLEVLKSKVNPDYKPHISMEIPLEQQNLEPETYSILSWIATKYWCEEPDENVQNSVMAENAKIQEAIEGKEEVVLEKCEEIREEQPEQVEEQVMEDTNSLLPIAHSDLKWYERIKMRIIEFFNKLLKKRKLKEERGNA